jgi:hypothetical protein
VSQQGFDLPQFGRRQIIALKPRRPVELVNEWEQCAVLMIGRAEMAQAEIWLGVERSTNAAVRRDLPRPASPEISTT